MWAQILSKCTTLQMHYSARAQIIWALRGKINASLVTMMSFILSTFSYTLSSIVKTLDSFSLCLYHWKFASIIRASLWPWTSQPWLESERWLHCSPICLIIPSALISDRGRAQPWAAPPSHLIISLSLQPFLEGWAYPEFWPSNQPSLPYCIKCYNDESCVIQNYYE